MNGTAGAERSSLLRWTNLLALLAAIAVNLAAVFLPLNGVQTNEWSDRWPTRVTPAGYAFSIWSVLYLWLIGFAVAQLAATRLTPWVHGIGWWFVASCGFNVAWLFAWHHGRLAVSLAMMLGLLTTLALIQARLDAVRARSADTGLARWAIRYPLGAYLGWIIVATVANVAIVLRWLGWDGVFPNPPAWAVLLIAVACVLGCFVGLRLRNGAVPVVVAWGLVAIAVEQSGFPWIRGAGWAAAALLVTAAATVALRSDRAVSTRT